MDSNLSPFCPFCSFCSFCSFWPFWPFWPFWRFKPFWPFWPFCSFCHYAHFAHFVAQDLCLLILLISHISIISASFRSFHSFHSSCHTDNVFVWVTSTDCLEIQVVFPKLFEIINSKQHCLLCLHLRNRGHTSNCFKASKPRRCVSLQHFAMMGLCVIVISWSLVAI